MSNRKAEFNGMYQAAVKHAQAGRTTEAEFEFARAAAFAPELWCDLATKLAGEGEEDMALDHYRTVLQVTQVAAIRSMVFTNVANIYCQRGQIEEAIEMFGLAVNEDPSCAAAYCNRGQMAKWQGRMEEAARYTERALVLEPWHSEAQFLQALNALDQGDYRGGFQKYECRWRARHSSMLKLECFQPEWPGPGAIDFRTGKPFERIFVYAEQGAGDIILMLRYAPLLRAQGLWQHWAVRSGMGGLIAGLVDESSERRGAVGEILCPERFDCHIPSASLPRLFGTTMATIPACPYLELKAAPVDYGPGRHVGIVWRGHSKQYNDRFRSTLLRDWQPVLEVPGVTFHSLQVDGADEALLYPKIVNHEPPRDWLETARRVAGLDLLIAVDTGIVHLAGALGLPVWCALHCRPYFVYPLAQAGTPWYPSVKLFKQTRAFEWRPVFERIANDLRSFVG